MTYSKRIRIAVLASFLIHVVLVGVFVQLMLLSAMTASVEARAERRAESRPLVLNFEPPTPERVPQLVETEAPAAEPPEETDFISDKNSIAQDESEAIGNEPQPFFQETDDAAQVPKPGAFLGEEDAPVAPVDASKTPAEPTPPQEPSPLPPTLETFEGEESQTGARLEPNAVEAVDVPAGREPEESVVAEPVEKAEDEPERMRIAQADTEGAQLVQEMDVGVGPEDGGATSEGFKNFAAQHHEMADYMLDIRRRVERGWKAGIQLKYFGTGHAEARLECAISPAGQIVYVRVLDRGVSATYANICKEAIEDAGPFPPFPIEVPDIYKNENLLIRWRFSLL